MQGRGAHPRSRGDHGEPGNAEQEEKGSSPLARGPLMRILCRLSGSGLIPARAGTTGCGGVNFKVHGAHPRSRGDHASSATRTCFVVGSSPLARGPLNEERGFKSKHRLIPARAGTTGIVLLYGVPARAHPRSRGDHLGVLRLLMVSWGSSPLARGPREAGHVAWVDAGLIPARAGTTLADMGFYPLHQQNRITLKPEPKSRIHDKQQLLTTTSTAIPARLTPP